MLLKQGKPDRDLTKNPVEVDQERGIGVAEELEEGPDDALVMTLMKEKVVAMRLDWRVVGGEAGLQDV